MPFIRTTHTYVVLDIDPEAFADISKKLRDAGYDHCFMPDGEIDMHGIAIAPDPSMSALALGAAARKVK